MPAALDAGMVTGLPGRMSAIPLPLRPAPDHHNRRPPGAFNHHEAEAGIAGWSCRRVGPVCCRQGGLFAEWFTRTRTRAIGSVGALAIGIVTREPTWKRFVDPTKDGPRISSRSGAQAD